MKMNLAGCSLAFALTLAVSAAGCSNEAGKESSSGTAATGVTAPAAGQVPVAEQAAVPAAGSGKVVGRVVFAGTPPAPQKINMSADPYCAAANPTGAERRTVVVGADGGLAGAVVYVASAIAGYSSEPPSEPVVIDQKNCGYVPRVVALRTGQPLEIRNSDSTLHNVHALPTKSKGFNVGMPAKGMKSLRKFANPEVFVRIKCDVHPWMESFAAVLDHPFFAVTDEAGAFEITGLPPGDHTLVAAHPKLGMKELVVSVSSGGTATADFTLTE
jgi:plastocyanin